MKSYTDLEQSKKLAEILPLESADMSWQQIYDENHMMSDYRVELIPYRLYSGIGIPCWSLAALLDVLPVDWWGYNKHYFLEISKMGDNAKPYEVCYYRFREQSDGADFGRIIHISYSADNPIDACYEMILNLNELNLL